MTCSRQRFSAGRVGRLGYGLAGLLLLVALPTHAAVDVRQIRVHHAPDYTRFVLDLSGSARFVVFRLAEPERVVIDLEGAALDSSVDFRALAISGSPVASIRGGARDGDDLRLVIDLSEAVRPKSFALPPVAPYGHRVVIDLHRDVVGTGDETRARNQFVRTEAKNTNRDVLVAIDAGHGGEDPGAVGPGRVFEKDIVLDIARHIAKAADAKRGFRALLVRDGDYYVALRKRTEKARLAGADFFVSIHADAFHSPLARGASVYAVSESGASSETARWLAEKENRADLIGGVRLDNKPDVLAGVLLDLSIRNSLSESLEAGRGVIRALGGVTHLHSKKVEQADFAVLKSPDVPSLLVETGYLSNPLEARRLSQPAYRAKLGRAILAGLVSYAERQPPAGTWLAAQAAQRARTIQYVIEPGDTLSEIAERFRISAKRLKRLNSLATDRIRVGQVLMVPAS